MSNPKDLKTWYVKCTMYITIAPKYAETEQEAKEAADALINDLLVVTPDIHPKVTRDNLYALAESLDSMYADEAHLHWVDDDGNVDVRVEEDKNNE